LTGENEGCAECCGEEEAPEAQEVPRKKGNCFNVPCAPNVYMTGHQQIVAIWLDVVYVLNDSLFV
jgi:hypothetical protein